jgi:glutamate synthase (NADPH/NADH) large chain
MEEVETDLLDRHEFGFENDGEDLDPGGEIEWSRNGEFHAWRSGTVRKLQAAVREGDYETYKEFSRTMNHKNESMHTLRSLLGLDTDRESVPVEEVEPVEDVVQRFFTGSMSFGSLSKEAHETLARAMNRLGAKSGSGEGGEPVERFGTERRSKIKQVASGRFGVTVSYLNDGDHIEIKMAQGSKPGEGGHLPGHKVNETIASTRHTTPGVALISPPPQHDIYSIEDLAQLIHDLKCGNPDADVHVKLVAEDGVGVIAAGVSKARADSVLISGHSGGTGASPRTSIKSAGLPWELGIAEAHQVLMENDLRSRIRVRVDGGMKTGRDVVIAALLGAEEYGFGTSALVSEGCVMVRKCHTNECPTGVATQDEERRKQFRGEVEHVMNYMEFMAQEVREYMAELGFRTERADDRTVAVRSVPAVFASALSPELLRDVLAAFVSEGDGGEGGASAVASVADELLADLACYPSVTGNTPLTEGSVVALLEALDGCENPYACPHGRPVVVSVDGEEIESRFERDYPGHGGRRGE